MKVHASRIIFVAVALSLFAGCSEVDDNSQESNPTSDPTQNTGKKGTLNVTLYGEEYVEDKTDLQDNWVVTYTNFDASVTNVKQGDTLLSEEGTVYTKNLKNREQVLFSKEVAVGKYNPSFDIVSIHIVGSATNGTVTKTFDWTFADDIVSYSDCHSETDVTEGGTGKYQIAIHSDHLFMNNISGQGPVKILFQAIADADTNGDNNGIITIDELKNTSIPGSGYDTGNEVPANVWDYMKILSRTVGHVNGNNHCTVKFTPKQK